MAVYFTADLHFNHAGVIGFDNKCGRNEPLYGGVLERKGERQ